MSKALIIVVGLAFVLASLSFLNRRNRGGDAGGGSSVIETTTTQSVFLTANQKRNVCRVLSNGESFVTGATFRKIDESNPLLPFLRDGTDSGQFLLVHGDDRREIDRILRHTLTTRLWESEKQAAMTVVWVNVDLHDILREGALDKTARFVIKRSPTTATGTTTTHVTTTATSATASVMTASVMTASAATASVATASVATASIRMPPLLSEDNSVIVVGGGKRRWTVARDRDWSLVADLISQKMRLLDENAVDDDKKLMPSPSIELVGKILKRAEHTSRSSSSSSSDHDNDRKNNNRVLVVVEIDSAITSRPSSSAPSNKAEDDDDETSFRRHPTDSTTIKVANDQIVAMLTNVIRDATTLVRTHGITTVVVADDSVFSMIHGIVAQDCVNGGSSVGDGADDDGGVGSVTLCDVVDVVREDENMDKIKAKRSGKIPDETTKSVLCDIFVDFSIITD